MDEDDPFPKAPVEYLPGSVLYTWHMMDDVGPTLDGLVH